LENTNITVQLYITLCEWSIVEACFSPLKKECLYMSTRAQSWWSAELASQATCLRTLLKNKGVIQFDLDDSSHIIRSVLD